uniref:Uncharacterized protein n=1 Tax=Ganoderma boninense TaxID=34458 RepID=A0A5K1JXD9_9APHY|nr:Eukaryotic translation initiation factor 3 subunit G (eIF3g) (Eukaryotic translation initiation factor 3 RNA-binding subunit) (eIF-3 RNA-binding subunit) (Translation initiation factor eIF3 p33 subunit homolog) (eIF3 p33 homolog) [Ganoderma boninense]
MQRPLQLQIYNTPDADVERLLTIAEMTNKYHFVSFEAWAMDALYNVISGLHGTPRAQYELGRCLSMWMKRLLEVALLCQHTKLLNYVAERWVERIIDRDLRPIHALDIADRSGIRELQGYAYFIQLLEMDDDFHPGVVEDGPKNSRWMSAFTLAGPHGNGNGGSSATERAGTPASLSCEHKDRLLSGHWSLSRLWERLQSKPPLFQQGDGCANHQQGCLATWTQVWQELGKSDSALKLPAADVPGRLRGMEQHLYLNGGLYAHLSRGLAPECRRSVIVALRKTIMDVEGGLADHFLPRVHTP